MNKIIFVIGSADISGGTYVIFQHALYLQQQGFNITIACCIEYDKYLAFQNEKRFWHPALNALTITSIDQITENHYYDLAIYTWWRTVYYFPQVNAKKNIYFVQSIESKFYDSSDKPLVKLVNDTYTFQLPIITEATWIKDHLKKYYNAEAMLAKNGVRKDLYTIEGNTIRPKTNKLRVLIEGPLKVKIKNIERTIELCSRVPGIELWLLTSSAITEYPNVDAVFSHVPIEQVGDIYRSCDVIVKLSYVEGMFAPPLEMFHCGGTCIVYDVTGHDEYIVDGYNGIVVKTDDEKRVVAALNQLNQDRTYLNKLKQGAIETAQRWIDWNEASRLFLECVEYLCQSTTKNTNGNTIKLTQQAFKVYEVSEQKKIPTMLARAKQQWRKVIGLLFGLL